LSTLAARSNQGRERFFKGLSLPVTRIGLEAGPLSQWLHASLIRAGFETVLLETRHVKAALSAMSVKTDRDDARGIAQLMRMGWFRPVHAKSVGSREVRALLVARKQLLSKLIGKHAGHLARIWIEGGCRDTQGI
jgi:transposase